MAAHGGLTTVGWLEGPTGVIWTNTLDKLDEDKDIKLNFNVSQGVSYELVTAVFGRGRMLARFQNVTISIPSDIKKGRKKYGQNIPMAAFMNQ